MKPERNVASLIPDPGPSVGPRMAECSPMARRFVMAMLSLGSLNHAQAARLAGSRAEDGPSLVQAGHQLYSNPKVMAAMHEQAALRLGSAQVMAVSQLVMMAEGSTNEPTKLKALLGILDRTGHQAVSEHHVTNTNIDLTFDQNLDALALSAKNLGHLVKLTPEMQKLIDSRQTKMIDVTPEQEDPDADILGI